MNAVQWILHYFNKNSLPNQRAKYIQNFLQIIGAFLHTRPKCTVNKLWAPCVFLSCLACLNITCHLHCTLFFFCCPVALPCSWLASKLSSPLHSFVCCTWLFLESWSTTISMWRRNCASLPTKPMNDEWTPATWKQNPWRIVWFYDLHCYPLSLAFSCSLFLCIALSCLVLCCLALSYLALPGFISLCLVLLCLAWSHVALSCIILLRLF